MPTDTTEKALETLIMLHMTGEGGPRAPQDSHVAETLGALMVDKAHGSGCMAGLPKGYDHAHPLDLPGLAKQILAEEPLSTDVCTLQWGKRRYVKNS